MTGVMNEACIILLVEHTFRNQILDMRLKIALTSDHVADVMNFGPQTVLNSTCTLNYHP